MKNKIKDDLSNEDYNAIIKSEDWTKWEEYQWRLLSKHFKKKSKRYTGCWDVNETMEIGKMSRGHLIAFCKFLINENQNLDI